MTPAQATVLRQYRAARSQGRTPMDAAQQVERWANVQLLISDYARPECDVHRVALQWTQTVRVRQMTQLVVAS